MIITTSYSHLFEQGMSVNISGKRYVVRSVPSQTQIDVRRTFWQWVLDTWAALWS